MYKLLIADDEEYIRTGLARHIKWELCGIEEVYTAEDSNEILEQIKKHSPDIIILDIKLPEISGLDLIPIIKKHQPNIEIIIISGYRNFEYAKKAISLCAVDYITKPIDEEEIQRVVKRCIENIENRKDMFKHSETLQKFTMDLLTETYKSKEDIIKKANSLKFEQTKYFLPFGFIIDQWSFMKSFYSIKKQKDLKDKILYQVYEKINEEYEGFIAGEINDYIYGIIIFEEKLEDEQWLDCLNKIVRYFDEILKISIVIGVDKLCHSLFGWHKIREKIDWSLSKRFYESSNNILVFRKVQHLYKQVDKEQLNKIMIEQQLAKYIMVQDEYNIKAVTDGIVKYFYRNKSEITEQEVRLIFDDILNRSLATVEHSNRMNIAFIEEQKLKISMKMMQEDTLDHLGHCFEKELIHLSLQLKNLVDDPTKKIIKEVIHYINENYNGKVSLQDAADFIHLNASYLSKIFSEEMQIPFSKYVMGIRMEKAEELMKDPRIKIYEIAELVGYQDIKYFTKVFKESKGMSPSKYRKKYV